MKALRARRSPLLSLALLASLGLTMLVLTHSLGYFRALAGAASPAMNFTVTSTADSGAGSLRQAIVDVNTLAGDDTILFDIPTTDPGYDPVNDRYTISLASRLPDLSTGIMINGPGANRLTVRRDSTGNFGIFTVTAAGVVTLTGMTVSNGRVTVALGGGIANFGGTVNVSGCVISGNSARDTNGGGIYNSAEGTVTITDCTISGNSTEFGAGGGIYTESGTVSITDSTISNNSAIFGLGGGIVNGFGSVIITRGTVSGNTALGGGGIYTVGTLKVINSTVSGNRADGEGGGIYEAEGIAAITSSTVTDNEAGAEGGGVFRLAGPVTAGNTIIAGNRSTTAAKDVGGATVFSAGYNLIGVSQDYGAFGASTGDQVGTPATPIDPLLEPLAFNGGPTQTHRLAAGSPAIDAGSNALAVDAANNPLATDQRGPGFPRVEGVAADIVDIGAFERDTRPPGVTINQAAGQSDPTATGAVNFTAVFTEPVSGFTAGDMMVTLTSGAGTAVVTQIAPNDGTTYNISVTLDQCARGVTVAVSIPAGTATDAGGNGNTASTSTDNAVTVTQNCSGCERGSEPAISCPGDVTVVATSPAGAVVNYTAPSCLDCFCDSQTPAQTAGLPSGATFPIGTTVNTYQVTDAGQTSTCSFSVKVLPPAVCPRPQGYWKNNPAAWPVGTLTLGGVAYSKSELLTLLTTPTGSGKNADASLILAGQLIAARLSIAYGSDPAPVSAAIAAADALLATFGGKLPYKVKPSTTPGGQMTVLASGLESFNKGLLTPGCAP